MSAENSAILFESEGAYKLIDSEGKELTSGKGIIQVKVECLVIQGDSASPRFFSYRDFTHVQQGDYEVLLPLESGGSLIISKLGLKFEDVVREISLHRHELLLTDLLADESLPLYQYNGQMVLNSPEGSLLYQGPGNIRLFPKSIAFFPLYGALPLSILLGSITEVKSHDYEINITSTRGYQCLITRLGTQYEPLCQHLSELIKAHLLSIQTMLKEIYPGLQAIENFALAQLFKEGGSVTQAQIIKESVSFWETLEKLFNNSGPEFNILSQMAPPERLSIGIQRGIWGDAERIYTWGLFPVYSLNSERPGNSIILEALTGDEENKATYVFKIMETSEYARMADIKQLEVKVEATRRLINEALLDIRFRREPIYLTEANLVREDGRDYRYSVKRIPNLATLRPLFTGRVIHSTPEQWEADLNKLLLKNVTVKG
jgi:hypothetical protein